MNQSLIIVAKIEAKPDHIERAKTGLLGLIPPTIAEAGCIQYELHQDNENPTVFVFYEVWKNRELWQTHMHSSHLTEFLASTEDALESVTVHEMSKC